MERAGFQVKWQVENNPDAIRCLQTHWPNVKRYEDIRTCGAELEQVDVIAGGFPCVDISAAGKQAGIEAERSGLWFEYARLIRLLRPDIAIIENVARLLVSGMDRVLGELAACGYDAEWQVLPARAFGAPHCRNRVFILAYPSGSRLEGIYEACQGIDLQSTTRYLRRHWDSEPKLDRVANGLSRWVNGKAAIIGCGNAVVPQVAEWIGRRIMEAASPRSPERENGAPRRSDAWLKCLGDQDIMKESVLELIDDRMKVRAADVRHHASNPNLTT